MRTLKVLLSSVGIFSLAIAYNLQRFDYNLQDGFWRTLMSPFEGTVWAEGFTEKGFSKIRPGMSSKDVTSILGAPLSKSYDCSKICFWNYTWQESPTADFDQRWVVFDSDSIVTEVRKSFFID